MLGQNAFKEPLAQIIKKNCFKTIKKFIWYPKNAFTKALEGKQE
jgi:hypothetical protein